MKRILFAVLSLMIAAVTVASSVSCGISVKTASAKDANLNLFPAKPSENLTFELSEDETYYILTSCENCKDEYIVIPDSYNGKPVKEIALNKAPVFAKGIKISKTVEMIGRDFSSAKFIFQNDDIWNKKDLNDRTVYEYSRYSKYGFIKFTDFRSRLTEKYKARYGKENYETEAYKNAVKALSGSDVWDNEEVNAFKKEFEDKGYTVVYLEPVKYNSGKIEAGGSPRLFAYKPVLKNRNVFLHYGIVALDTIAVDENNKTFFSKNNCVIERETGKLIAAVGRFDIPDDGSVKSLGTTAFWYNRFTPSVVLPESLTEIEPYVSADFIGISRIYVVFNKSDCDISAKWAEETIGNNPEPTLYLRRSDDYESVAPRGVFIVNKDGETVNTVTVKNEKRNYKLTENNEFLLYNENGKYKTMAYLGKKDTVSLPKDENGEYCLPYTMNGVKNVIWPRGLEEISGSFGASLESIEIPEGVTKIGASAFANTGLETVKLPSTLQEIGPYAFSGCRSLKSVKIPKGVTEIGSGAFSGCRRLESVEISDGVTYLPDHVFTNCESLKKVTIPKSVERIGEFAFLTTDEKTEVYYEGSAEDWQKISIDAVAGIDCVNVHYGE